jgi:hypothetical protein
MIQWFNIVKWNCLSQLRDSTGFTPVSLFFPIFHSGHHKSLLKELGEYRTKNL